MSGNFTNDYQKTDGDSNVVNEPNLYQPYKYDPAFDEARKFTKLFVGGLPFSSTDHALYNYFNKFGEILEAVVIKDRFTEKSKGYGFVTMKDPASAEKAIRNSRPIIDGRRCNVNYAFIGAKSKFLVNVEKVLDFNWSQQPSTFDQNYYQYLSPNSPAWTYTNQNCHVGFPMYQNMTDYYRYGFLPYCMMYQQENNQTENNIPNIVPKFNANMNLTVPHMIPPQFPYFYAYSPGPTFGNFYYTPNPYIPSDSNSPKTNLEDEINNPNNLAMDIQSMSLKKIEVSANDQNSNNLVINENQSKDSNSKESVDMSINKY